jgi:hypothetical protein
MERRPYVPDAGAFCDCHPQGLQEGQRLKPCQACPYYDPEFPEIIVGDVEATVRLNQLVEENPLATGPDE